MAQKKITDLQLRSAVTADLSIPSDDGIQSYRITPSQLYDFLKPNFSGPQELSNLTLTTAVGSSALTIAVKNLAGNTPSSTDFCRIAMRSSTLTSGSFTIRTIAAALSVVVSSGSTLGQVSAQPSRIWVYLIDNAGTLELAVSHKYYGEDGVVSTTAEGGAGAADSATVMYSTTARTNVAFRSIGYILNTQTTAGTWASAGTQIQLAPYSTPKYPTIQRMTSGSGTYITPAGCTKLIVWCQGGGAGGGGSQDTVGSHVGTAGNASSFGTSLITCAGGTGGAGGGAAAAGGDGGAPTVNSPAIVMIQVAGGKGGADGQNSSIASVAGGQGGVSFMGGQGANTVAAQIPSAAGANTGGGGAGAPGTASPCYPGLGGGAGAFAMARINAPDASYAYVVGASATGGTAGTNGQAGGDSGSGMILVEEFYD